jgi:adenylate cyclase
MESTSQTAPSQATSAGRLLVVDDSLLSRAAFSRSLQLEKYEVRLAESGAAALEQLRLEPFDLVLLDVVMPEMDGFAVLRALKQDPALRHIPVLMISAGEEIENVARCIEMGAEDYLLKPPNPVMLRARLNALIERKRLRDEEQRRAVELREALAEIERQRHVSESLLLSILPQAIAQELQSTGKVTPRYFNDVTVVFTDFVGFTSSTESIAVEKLVDYLNRYFTAFDRIILRYELEKMKTIGDSYMFVSGMPERAPSHPVDALLASLEMLEFVRAANEIPAAWKIRIGAHSGPLIAGVVGVHKFAFDVWGDTVNFSSRMESGGAPNRINISRATYTRVKDFFQCEPRGKLTTRDGRETEMYFVDGILPELLGDGRVPEAFLKRYRMYFGREPRSFPEFYTNPEMSGSSIFRPPETP